MSYNLELDLSKIITTNLLEYNYYKLKLVIVIVRSTFRRNIRSSKAEYHVFVFEKSRNIVLAYLYY